VVFVELPEPGRQLEVGAAYAVVESVKAAADVYAPVGGKVTAVNSELAAAPERINSDPYGAGWLVRLEPVGAAAAAQLMSAAEYRRQLESEEA